MTMFQADRDQSAELQREILHARTTQLDAQARRQGDVAAYAHGRADELVRILDCRDDPDRALSRANLDIPNARGRGKNYVLGERSAAQFVRHMARTGRVGSVCTLHRRRTVRTLLGLRPAATEVEVLELTHNRSGIDAARILDTPTGKTWWVRGHALRRLTVSAH